MNRLLVAASLITLLSLPAFAQPAPGKPEPKKDTPAATQPTAKPTAQPTAKPAAKPADKKADDKNAEEEAWKKAGEPGPNHKLLEAFEGEWQAEVKELGPAGESVSKGVMTCKMVFGGRYLSMDYDGRFHGKFFRGGGYMGYNNTDKRFENVWADSMSTALIVLTGNADSAGKVFNMAGEYTDPTTNKKAKQRQVLSVVGKDSFKEEFFMEQGGKETKVMDITYSRGKADKKEEAKKDDKMQDSAKPK